MVGHSALMGEDEEGTLTRLRRHLITPLLAQHEGRLVQTGGDSFLFEFASITAAVRAAVELQRSLSRFRARCGCATSACQALGRTQPGPAPHRTRLHQRDLVSRRPRSVGGEWTAGGTGAGGVLVADPCRKSRHVLQNLDSLCSADRPNLRILP
jgi:hypothetical protein